MDAHIFCTKNQINSETENFCKLLTEIYNDFGFKKIDIRFADRPEVRSGSNEIWNQAEESLLKAIEKVRCHIQKIRVEEHFMVLNWILF